MSQKNPLIQRNPISGDWERTDIDNDGTAERGEHSAKALEQRARDAHAALEKAIAGDSQHAIAQQTEQEHPVLQPALSRLNSEPNRTQPNSREKRYNHIHGGDPNAKKQDDKTERFVVPVKK